MSVDNQISQARPVLAGVPQGSPLSPVLYNLFTYDIPKQVGVDLYLFADDTAITYKSKNARLITERLQNHLNQILLWMKSWKININGNKTQAIFFTRGKKTRPHGHVKIDTLDIPWVNQVKF